MLIMHSVKDNSKCSRCNMCPGIRIHSIVLNKCSCLNKHAPSTFWWINIPLKIGENRSKMSKNGWKSLWCSSGTLECTRVSVNAQGAFIRHYMLICMKILRFTMDLRDPQFRCTIGRGTTFDPMGFSGVTRYDHVHRAVRFPCWISFKALLWMRKSDFNRKDGTCLLEMELYNFTFPILLSKSHEVLAPGCKHCTSSDGL